MGILAQSDTGLEDVHYSNLLVSSCQYGLELVLNPPQTSKVKHDVAWNEIHDIYDNHGKIAKKHPQVPSWAGSSSRAGIHEEYSRIQHRYSRMQLGQARTCNTEQARPGQACQQCYD